MFPNGGAHLVEFIMNEGTKAMSEHLQKTDLSHMTVNERIAEGIKSRILHMSPVLPVLPQAMATAASTPAHLPAIVQQAGLFADELWFQVGDTSTSLDWYSRRALLVLINFMTELHIVQDTSPGYADTWAFLDRRLADAQSMGTHAFEALSAVSAAASGLGGVLESGLSALQPVTSSAVTGPAAAFSAAIKIANGVASQAMSAGAAAATAAPSSHSEGFSGSSPGEAPQGQTQDWASAQAAPDSKAPQPDFESYTPPPPDGDFDLTGSKAKAQGGTSR
jgi:rpsU-divergently transcribed protein